MAGFWAVHQCLPEVSFHYSLARYNTVLHSKPDRVFVCIAARTAAEAGPGAGGANARLRLLRGPILRQALAFWRGQNTATEQEGQCGFTRGPAPPC